MEVRKYTRLFEMPRNSLRKQPGEQIITRWHGGSSKVLVSSIFPEIVAVTSCIEHNMTVKVVLCNYVFLKGSLEQLN